MLGSSKRRLRFMAAASSWTMCTRYLQTTMYFSHRHSGVVASLELMALPS